MACSRYVFVPGAYVVVLCRHTVIYDKVKSCYFRPARRFRSGLARPISAPLGSPTGNRPVTRRSRVSTSPSPVARATRSQSRKKRVSFAGRPSGSAVPSRLLVTHSAIQLSSNKNVQPIPYIFSMTNSLLYNTSINTPHVHMKQESHPSMCTHHAAAKHAGWLPVRDDAP